MKKIATIMYIISFIISIVSTTSFAYFTESAVGNDLIEHSLPTGNGNIPGTHRNFSLYTINNIDFKSGVNRVLQGFQETILRGNSDEDDETTASAFTHFYDPLIPTSIQPGLGLVFGPNAKTKAEGYYYQARKFYQNDKNGAWNKIGRALHLLQDMAVPAHVHRSNHFQHSVIWKNGYEWWVARHWDDDRDVNNGKYQGFMLRSYIDYIFRNNPNFRRPIVAGDMGGYMDAMAIQSYYGYEWDYAPLFDPAPLFGINGPHAVEGEEARHTASVLVPTAIAIGGGLLQGFCQEVNCTGPLIPSANNSDPGGGHPDDNFDVSSRLIELEELDITKQAWKDLYGRTGIKKGYNGFFLEKAANEAKSKLLTATTEAEFNATIQQFQPVIDRVQKEAKYGFEDTYYASADVALLSDAFVDNAAELLLKRLREPIREVKETFHPSVLLKNQPVLLIPSGALTGFVNSTLLKSSLDEYVKQGGTLVVLSQKHGYDYASIPTPDGRPITGYGWVEDQNCFADSVSIETWHQIFSGQLRSTPTINVDGYFTGYPANSTVLLRRTANGQPALLMYEHGLGRVIVTSMYSDWAYGHGQASQEEIALMRDILSWAKKPAQLPDFKPDEVANISVTVSNSTSTDAASVKVQIWNPDRTTLLSEQTLSLPVPAGQSASTAVLWPAPADAKLGIYHADYLLLDAAGNIIQPQAETDSGRFAISNPPQVGTKTKDIQLSISSPNQEVFFNEPFVYTFHIYNNTDTPRNLILKSWLPHTDRRHEWTVTANPNGETTVNGSDLFLDTRWMFETLRAYLYDESGKEIGSYMLSFKGVYPKVEVTTSIGKGMYAKGETVDLAVSLNNIRSAATAAKLRVTVTDPANIAVYVSTPDVTLPAGGTSNRPFSFTLPANAQGGLYTVYTEVHDANDNKIGGDATSFELPLSLIFVIPVLPPTLVAGSNTISFNLNNTGKLPVSAGTLNVNLFGPDGESVASVSQPFALAAGQNTSLRMPISMPALKFGAYTLSFTQNDETKNGKTATISLANTMDTTFSFDKTSYRVRETAHLAVTLTNAGRFGLENVNVTLSAPDAGYADTKTMTIGQGQVVPLQYTIPLPTTMTAGQHDIKITITLPSGCATIQTFTFTVPQSLLVAGYSGPDTVTAGDTMILTIENTGGTDTSYDTGSHTIVDSKGLTIYQGNAVGAILAGEKKILKAIGIPTQAAAGNVFLNLQVLDKVTGKSSPLYKNLSIVGVSATVQALTDQESYLTTGAVTGVTTIANGGALIEGGSLKITVRNGGAAIPLNGLRLWLKADVGISRDASDFVSWWADQSGNNFDVTQRASSKQPLFVDNAVNGKPAIRFDGIDDYLQTSGAINLIAGTKNYSFFVVVKPGSAQKMYADIIEYFHGVNTNFVLQRNNPNAVNDFDVFGTIPQRLDSAQFQMFTQVTVNGSSGYSYLNGGNKLSEPNTRNYSEPNYFAVGNCALERWSRQFNGNIAEIIFYNAALSDTNRIAVERYLLSKYAIDATPAQTNDTLFETVIPLTQSANSTSTYNTNIGLLNVTGKLYLTAELKNSLGQIIGSSEYPFYVITGKTALTFNPDKKLYKRGETVTINGAVKNLAVADAANISLVLKTKDADNVAKTLATEAFTVLAGGSHPFTVTTTADAEGTIALTGIVAQSGSTLAEIADQYEVAPPIVTATLTAPDVVGNEQFAVSCELKNTGKTNAVLAVASPFTPQPETFTLSAGETRLIQYSTQISADASYSFTFSGDLNQTVAKTIKYGLAGTVAFISQAIYPEGKIIVPVTVTNTGLLDSQMNVNYLLHQGAINTSQQASYYLAKGNNTADTLSFDLTEGSYQVTATGQLPAMTAAASFSVRKLVKADLQLSVGAQTGTLLPATVSVTNLGYNTIDGTVRLSLVDGNGAAVWNSNQDLSLPQSLSPVPQSLAFSINLAAVKPGVYSIKAELLDTANQQLVRQTSQFSVLGAVFDLTQLPPYQTVSAGGSATMTFRVKNSGSQEGNFDLSFKADDLIDSTQTAWLKPGEEKEIAFNFQAATDLEEKDYSATYRLKSGGATVKEGVMAYHLAGLKLAVSATLDKQAYNKGDTATLTLTISQQDAGASPSLFARVNYAGYEEKRDFRLSGSQTLTFNVPLTAITGEKLFYGIYYQSGRSVYLNTLYIHKADGVLTVTTDKQVYNPGETVIVFLAGTASGNLTLTGPGDLTNTFAFAGSDTRSFVLPSSMTAGTYTVSYSLTDTASSDISGSTPFDVAGIQIKVKEALLDKAKYASTDTMTLSLTIESNLDIPATVRTWVVDPATSYTDSGSGDVALSAASPVVTTRNASLAATSTGIHKLVYGIYQGDLLLASGAKAFDIGEAVLLGLSTDKADFPETTTPVAVKADLYGTTDAGLEFFLDGVSIKADTVTLTGFNSYTLAIPPASITPGPHTLKAVLTTGGLTSTKEVRFTYGSNLPDLAVRLASDTVKGSSLMLTVTVGNQGKTVSGATTVSLYDGDPSQGGTAFATLNVPALAPRAAVNLGYAWYVLGKSGDYVVHTVVDPANRVTEYNEANNATFASGALPKLALGVATGGTSFRANTDIGIAVNYANLSTSSSYQDLVLRIDLTNPQGVISVLKEASIASLAPATDATNSIVWNTTSSLPGSYTVNASLIGGGSTLVAGSASFAVEPTLSVSGSLTLGTAEVMQGAPLAVSFTLNNGGNVIASGTAKVLIIDPQNGAIMATAEQAVSLPVNGLQSGDVTFPTQGFELKGFLVRIEYVSQETCSTIANASFTVIDGTPPVVAVLSPQAGGAYNSTLAIAALVTDDASGVDKVEYQVDDGVWQLLLLEEPASGKYATTWPPTTSDNGSHTICVRGFDKAGNPSFPVPVTFTFDTVPPQLTLSTLGDGANTNNETLNISGSVHDNLGLEGLLINDMTVPVSADGSFSHVIILKSGANSVSTVATDLAKNRTVETRTVNLDQSAPVLNIAQPADNSKTANSLQEVAGTVDENATVEVKIKDNVQTASMNGTSFTSTVGLDSGLNTIEVTAKDLAGNPSSQKRTVIFDDQKPSLAVTEPNQDIRTNRSSIMVKGTASDPYAAVGVTITKDTEILAPPVINGAFEQVVTFTEEKPYAIRVTATNEVGTQTSVQRNVIYDITPPVLTIGPVSSPTNKASQELSGTREEGAAVTATCATAAVGEVAYPTATTWKVTVSNLKDGDNIIAVVSVDVAGNQTPASTKIVFVERAPDVTITATPNSLWPPNHKVVPVTLGGEVIPHGSDIQSLSISVADEYGKYIYRNLRFGDVVPLEAWRKGNDMDGRIYTITAVATDMAGNTTAKTTTVIVPHDASK